jgi:predicted nucleic acid-binding protein
MEKSNIFLDTDVILNWLIKEVDQNTGFKLWKCPYEIMKLIEKNDIKAYTSITNIFEIRFVLRR